MDALLIWQPQFVKISGFRPRTIQIISPLLAVAGELGKYAHEYSDDLLKFAEGAEAAAREQLHDCVEAKIVEAYLAIRKSGQDPIVSEVCAKVKEWPPPCWLPETPAMD